MQSAKKIAIQRSRYIQWTLSHCLIHFAIVVCFLPSYKYLSNPLNKLRKKWKKLRRKLIRKHRIALKFPSIPFELNKFKRKCANNEENHSTVLILSLFKYWIKITTLFFGMHCRFSKQTQIYSFFIHHYWLIRYSHLLILATNDFLLLHAHQFLS